MDIKQEDLIKFWTWCGLPQSKTSIWWRKNVWDANPDLTLNTIYDWAIPKLQEKGYQTELIARTLKGFAVRITDMISGKVIITESDNSTEALYMAIMEVIENER